MDENFEEEVGVFVFDLGVNGLSLTVDLVDIPELLRSITLRDALGNKPKSPHVGIVTLSSSSFSLLVLFWCRLSLLLLSVSFLLLLCIIKLVIFFNFLLDMNISFNFPCAFI